MAVACADAAAPPQVVVFIGPSLPRADARRLLRVDAELRPPVRRGDFDRLGPHVAVACILDGVFFTEHAVSAREILQALRRGVRVIGASSMGALRAAELVPFGMEGIGQVFAMYATGEIDSDAEVALTFDPETQRATSEPLVNMRVLLRHAQAEGVLDADAAHAVLDVARRIHFFDLSYPTLLARLDAVLPADALARLAAFVRDRARALDVKRADARAALEHLNRAVGAASAGAKR